MLDAFYRNLYRPGFVFSVDRAFVASCQTPCLVLAGNDAAHPYAIAEEMVKRLPQAAFIAEWKDGAALVSATSRISVPGGTHAGPGLAPPPRPGTVSALRKRCKYAIFPAAGRSVVRTGRGRYDTCPRMVAGTRPLQAPGKQRCQEPFSKVQDSGGGLTNKD